MKKEEFRALRQVIGTQEEVARRMGISQRTVQGWEQGLKPVPGWAPNALRYAAEQKSKELKALAQGDSGGMPK